MPPRSRCPTRSGSKTACSRSCDRLSNARRSSASSAGRSRLPRGCARPSACRTGPAPAPRARARRSARIRSGALAAEIEIRSAPELTELLAHEFEHLIEQLDGVGLEGAGTGGRWRAASRMGPSKPTRAVAAGQQVAGEVTNNAPDRVRGRRQRLCGGRCGERWEVKEGTKGTDSTRRRGGHRDARRRRCERLARRPVGRRIDGAAHSARCQPRPNRRAGLALFFVRLRGLRSFVSNSVTFVPSKTSAK